MAFLRPAGRQRGVRPAARGPGCAPRRPGNAHGAAVACLCLPDLRPVPAGCGGHPHRPGHGLPQPAALYRFGPAGHPGRYPGGGGVQSPVSSCLCHGASAHHGHPTAHRGRSDRCRRCRAGGSRGRSGRFGRDHLHHRLHRSAQGRAVHPRHLPYPAGIDPRLLRHRPDRRRPARLSAVRPVRHRPRRPGGDPGHGPDPAGRGRPGEIRPHPAGPPGDLLLRLAGHLERGQPVLPGARPCPAGAQGAHGRGAGAGRTGRTSTAHPAAGGTRLHPLRRHRKSAGDLSGGEGNRA